MAKDKNKANSSLYDISQRIILLRESKGLTQERLADMVGVKNTTISAYENDINFPSLEVLIRLANIFNVTTDQLLGVNELEVSNIEQSYYENLFKDMVSVKGLSDKNRKLIESLIETIKNPNN